MKKIAVFLMLFVLAYMGGSYYLGNFFVKQYEENFAKNFPPKAIITHTQEKGIFKTKIKSNVTFVKKDLVDFFKMSDEDIRENLSFKYITNVSHPFFSIINGIKGDGVVNITSYEDIVSKTLKNGELAKYTFKFSNGGKGDIKTTINEIYYNDDIGMIKFSPIVIDAKYENGGFSTINSKEDTIKIKLHTDEFEFSLNGIEYNVTYDEPFNIDYNDLYKFVSSSSEFVFKNFVFKAKKAGDKINFEIPNFKDNSKIDVNNGVINITSISSADRLLIDFNKDTFKFSDIKSDISFKNLNGEFYKAFVETMEKYATPDISNQDAKTLVQLFIEKNPSLEFKNFSFKYDNKHNFALNFKSGVNKFDLSNPMNILNNIYLDGKAVFDKTLLDLILEGDVDSKNIFIDSGILKENGDDYSISFKYEKDKMDVILNDKIGASQLLSIIF